MNQYPNNFNFYNQNNQYYGGYNGNNPNQQHNEYMRQQMYNSMLKRKEKSSLFIDGLIIGATIIMYLIVQIIIVGILYASPYYHLFNDSPVFQSAFNVVTVHVCSMAIPFSIMAVILKKRFTGPLIPTKKISGSEMCAWIALGMGLAMLASMATNVLINVVDKLGYKLTQPEILEPDSVFALVVSAVAIAVVPGIFEEYAFRCCTLGALKKYGKGFAVITVSVVFGLIHGNIIQFVFAFLVGLVLGYITVVTDNVIPAMFIHAFNNGLSVVTDTVKYFSGETTAKLVTGAIIYIWLGLAVIGLIYLIVNRELLPKKEQKPEKKPYELSFGEKLICVLPGFIIPFFILILLTTQYIQRK